MKFDQVLSKKLNKCPKSRKKAKKVVIFIQISKNDIFASFKDFLLIFCANENWYSMFFKSKVFHPPTIVYPLILSSENPDNVKIFEKNNLK